MATLLVPGRTSSLPGAESGPDALWVPLGQLQEATGWELKPEGACRDDVCVPLPRGREAEFASNERFNFAAFARYFGLPAEYHAASDTWAFGESAESRTSALQSLEAPDFTLPDLEGRQHSLSDYRGRKVFLVSWASW